MPSPLPHDLLRTLAGSCGLALLLLAFKTGDLKAEAGAPLMVRSEAIGQIFRLNPPIFGTFNPDQQIQVEASRTYANLWARDKRFLIDAEVLDDRVRLILNPHRLMKLGLGFSSRRFAQTRTDQIAISFHDIFRIGQDGRLEAGKHHTNFKIPDYSLEFSQADLNRSVSEQFSADLSFPLLDSQAWPFTLSATVFGSYETARGSPYFAESFDRGVQINARYPWAHGAAYASLSQLYFDGSQQVDVATVRQQLGWAGGVVQTLTPDQEILGQLMVYQPVFRQLGQLSRNSYEAHLGYRLRVDRVYLEATLIENIFWLYNSPDWGLSLGLRAALL